MGRNPYIFDAPCAALACAPLGPFLVASEYHVQQYRWAKGAYAAASRLHSQSAFAHRLPQGHHAALPSVPLFWLSTSGE